MDISGVKVDIKPTLNIEKVSPSFKLGGDKNTQNLSVEGNFTINNTYVGTASINNPDLIESKVEQITSGNQQQARQEKVSVVVSPFMGIVKSPERPGTRLHLEFAVINEGDMPLAINGVYVKIGEGKAHFKKFFIIKENSVRVPDFSIRFPIIVNSKGAARLPVEFENIGQKLIVKGEIISQIFVLIGNEQVASKEFTLDVNEAMWNTLAQLQEVATKEKAPLIFDAMLKI